MVATDALCRLRLALAVLHRQDQRAPLVAMGMTDPAPAVAVHPMRHQPDRPWWTCSQGCGDWPCPTFRSHMLGLNVERSAVLALMESYYPSAVVEMGEEGLADRRLFEWARRAEVRRPPGGLF
jgi:hypothetical protein